MTKKAFPKVSQRARA